MAWGPRITIGKPKVTLSQNDQNAVWTGLATAAAVGAVAATGGAAAPLVLVAAGVGGLGAGMLSKRTGQASIDASNRAADESERLRRDNIVKEFGARQQADSMSFTSANRSSGSTSTAPGVVGGNEMPGSIGVNMSSGTF